MSKVINGHELEKIKICKLLGSEAEKAIWAEQALPFWNGEVKQLIKWAKESGFFELSEFKRICNLFIFFSIEKRMKGGPPIKSDRHL